jgi:AcrR family transcriptional regulator
MRNRAAITVPEAPIPTDRSTQERVLDTAAELFWTKGFGATTTREIAARLGIRQASLYHYVASKEELLYHLCVTSLEQFLLDVHSALERPDSPLDRMRTLIHVHLTTLLKRQRSNAVMTTELRALTGAYRVKVLSMRAQYADLVRAMIEEGQTGGLLRTDITSNDLCLALLNFLNWTLLWFRSDEALTAGQLAEFLSAIYLDGGATAQARGSFTMPESQRRPKRPTAIQNTGSVRLLNKAAELFAKKGYDLTSTREIALVVGIQKASLYYHIDTKEDLLYAICKSSLKQIRSDVEAAVDPSTDPLRRIAALSRAHIESMLRDQARHSAALSEMHSLSAGRRAEVVALRDDYEGLVRSVLLDAQKAGALRDDVPVKYLCLGLLGLLNRVVVWFRRSGPLSPSQLGEVFARIYLTGVAASPRRGR